MTTVSIEDPQFQSAIQACAVALRRMATYKLDPSLHRRMRALGELKEFLTPAEHEELLALVDFAHQRTIEKLGSSGFRPSADGASWHAVRPMSASPDPLRDAVVRRAGNRSLSKLAKYTSHIDDGVRQGALTLWGWLVSSILDERYSLHYAHASRGQKFRSLRFDWRMELSLTSDADVTKKRQGITLLTLSNFPITDAAHRADLLIAMANAQETDELEAWARLLREIPISQARKAVWQEVLESVLAQPRKYSSIILSAALERYATLAGEEGSHILGDETALGLPVVVTERA
jgi:hypothetical protein